MAFFEVFSLKDAGGLYSGSIGTSYTNVTLTNGSTTVSGLSGMSSSNIGQNILSTTVGIQSGAIIQSVTNATTVVISLPYIGVTTSAATCSLYPFIGSALDTLYYNSLTIQISGLVTGTIYIEGSNDATNWQLLSLFPVNEYSMVDHIETAGIYSLKTSTRYVRYNATYIGSSFYISVLGRSGAGPAAIDIVAGTLLKQTDPLATQNALSVDQSIPGVTNKIFAGGTSSSSAIPNLTVAAHSAGTVCGTGYLTFANALGSNFSGVLDSIVLTAKVSSSVGFKLYLFTSPPLNTTWTDTGTPSLNTLDVVNLKGVYSFGSPDTGLTSCTIWEADAIAKAIVSTSTNLYGVLVCTSAYTPASVSELTVTINLLKD